METNKHRQAKEIRELRRKLRESRLILPPRTYRALNKDGAEEGDEEEGDGDEGKGDEEDELAEIDKLGKEDEHFSRVRTILDALLESGRQALQTKVEDFALARGAAKVLHEEEARNWRYGGSHPRVSLGHDADDTFDETFVTAESGDESGNIGSRRPSRNMTLEFDNNASAENLLQVIVDDVDDA